MSDGPNQRGQEVAFLGEIVVTAGRTNTFLGQRYRRIAKRGGHERAPVAVGNSVLTIVWHLLAEAACCGTEDGVAWASCGCHAARGCRMLEP